MRSQLQSAAEVVFAKLWDNEGDEVWYGEEKMSRELKCLYYDEEADVLYVSLGHPEYTDYAEVNDDLVLRFDPETKDIVGFTIIDFLAHFSQPKPRLRIPLAASFQPLVDVKELVMA